DVPQALALVAGMAVDLVVADRSVPGAQGLVAQIHALRPGLAVAMMTDSASVRDAVEAMQSGAFDYIVRPLDAETLRALLLRALRLRDTPTDNIPTHATPTGDVPAGDRSCAGEERPGFDAPRTLIGTSKPFQRVLRAVSEVGRTETTVLLRGESGTGKDMVARAIHDAGPRRDRPFVTVSCAALPEAFPESELFGHVRGAFAGALSDHTGRLELARGGTLFLDEAGDMPLSLQAKLSRVLQEGAFGPVGSGAMRSLDVRIIAATGRNLEEMMAAGSFRADLYYRLNGFMIALPPLRERLDDLPLLVRHIAAGMAPLLGRSPVRFDAGAIAAMKRHSWPGNIRELKNYIRRTLLSAEGREVGEADLPLWLETGTEKRFERPENNRSKSSPSLEEPELPGDLDEALRQFERMRICAALSQSRGVQVRAAQMLGIGERSLWHRIRKLGIPVVKTSRYE
ncbi:sigma 54-interacting transcriptional regulator, partial [Brucella intermedia]|uniref:sigma 54-interacting transcriptional regulator n=1 Tax=Brucella intermedia TaxID=94625 RepID=UPI003B641420